MVAGRRRAPFFISLLVCHSGDTSLASAKMSVDQSECHSRGYSVPQGAYSRYFNFSGGIPGLQPRPRAKTSDGPQQLSAT